MSVALHGLLLWPQAPRRDATPPAPRGAPVLTAYLIGPQRAAVSSPPAGPSTVVRSTSTAAASQPTAATTSARAGPSALEALAKRDTGTDAPAQVPGLPPSAGNVQPEPQYWPRSRLTRGPQPRSPVVLTLPPSWRTPGRYRAQFALYVDEQGVVQRVERLTNPDFPAPLESEVRSAFMGVLFEPGEMNGTAVRARMVVEVDFDAASPGPPR